MDFLFQPMGRMLIALLMVSTVHGLSAAPHPQHPGETNKPGDKDKIQGTWKFESVLDAGREQPMPERNRVVITPGMLKMVYPDEESGWRYTIDPSKDPKEMDWVIEIDPGRPIRQLAIYSLDGDTLRICFTGAGLPRPTKLVSKKGDLNMLWVLKRVAEPTTKRSG